MFSLENFKFEIHSGVCGEKKKRIIVFSEFKLSKFDLGKCWEHSYRQYAIWYLLITFIKSIAGGNLKKKERYIKKIIKITLLLLTV